MRSLKRPALATHELEGVHKWDSEVLADARDGRTIWTPRARLLCHDRKAVGHGDANHPWVGEIAVGVACYEGLERRTDLADSLLDVGIERHDELRSS